MASAGGGLGIYHPSSSSIPTLVLSIKRSLQYATDGIWIGNSLPLFKLPYTIISLYQHWEESPAKPFVIFRKYLPSIATTCVGNTVEDQISHFLHKSSINKSCEQLQLDTAKRTKIIVQRVLKHDKNSLDQLEDLLSSIMSYALLEMSRLPPIRKLSKQ